MLPANSTLRANAPSPGSRIERLIHRLRAGQTDAAGFPSPDPEVRRYCTGAPACAHGFDWTAPIYEAPHTPKDTRSMHDPARDISSTPEQGQPEAFRWRRHPALLRATTECCLPEGERRARLAAVRGVLAAREGDLDAAAASFLEAAREPAIRFQVVPGFWGCTRGGMNAAVAAYEAAGRFRDAASLAATIRTRYRPRALHPGASAAATPDPAPNTDRDRTTSAAATGD